MSVNSDGVSAEEAEYDSEMVTQCNRDLGGGRHPEISAFSSCLPSA